QAGLDHAQPELGESAAQIGGVVEELREQRRTLPTADADRLERRADRGRYGRRGEHEGPRGDLQVLDHLPGAGDEPPARGAALGEGPHPEVDLVLNPEQLARPRAALPADSDRVALVAHPT